MLVIHDQSVAVCRSFTSLSFLKAEKRFSPKFTREYKLPSVCYSIVTERYGAGSNFLLKLYAKNIR